MRKTLLVLAMLSPALTTCGWGPLSKKKNSKNKSEYFIHGDPLQMIEGATTVKTSFLNPEDLTKFNGFHAANAVAFIEQEPKEAPTSFAEVEEGNSTDATEDEIDGIFAVVPYEFVQVNETRWEYRPTVNPERNYTMGFQLKDGLLELVDTDGFPIEVMHYSLKADESAMSFLFLYKHPNAGKVLLSVSFAASEDVKPITHSQADYSYLIGAVEVRWLEPMKIYACGKFSENEKATITASTSRWLSDPKRAEGSTAVPVTFEVVEDYPPFSDMNRHCLHLVRSFRLEASDHYYTAGVTLPTINSATKGIIDSDVFLFMDHFNVARQFNGSPSTVLMHELGHFFGLGHEFRYDALTGEPVYPSIMAYSRATSYISEWDFSAVHALYGGYLTSGNGE